MKTTILIPLCTEFEAQMVLYSLKKIDEFRHPLIEQEIIICDQLSKKHSLNFDSNIGTLPIQVQKEIKIMPIPRIDAGYPINVGAMNATGQFFCTLDADAFPIHRNWLYLPIKLIEKYGLSFVGKSTGLNKAYTHEGNFFHINNYFRVSFTNTARRCAQEVGFMRYEHRKAARFRPKVNSNWKTDCDNGVVAQWYSDMAHMGDKVSLALTRCVGITNEMGLFGMIIDDLIFHLVFGFGEQWIQDQQKTLGSDYLGWKDKMKQHGIEHTLDAMVNMAAPKYPKETDREHWNGQTAIPLNPNDEMWQFIEQTKNS